MVCFSSWGFKHLADFTLQVRQDHKEQLTVGLDVWGVAFGANNWPKAGQFLFYAVHLPSLADVAGFPISIDGHNADNDPTR
jgi:hypothetical protein